ncbi:MAG TPA: hypothetical protein VGF45_07750 [Polyangia bacterium]
MRLSAVALGAPSAFVFVSALSSSSVVASEEAPPRYGLRLEAGAEYDSNPTRRETVAGGEAPIFVPSPAARVAVAGDVDQRLGERFQLAFAGGVAARRLIDPAAQPEDLVVSDGHLSLSLLGERSTLSAVGSAYDVVQRADSLLEARDFRSLSAGARGILQHGQNRFFVAAGWRWFAFKPDDTFDFAGPTGTLGYRRTPQFAFDGSAEWEFGAQGSIESRGFLRRYCPTTSCDAGGTLVRQDRFITFETDVTRTADQLFGLGLALQHNDSVRFGETLSRLLAHARLVWLLPWELSLAARAELVATRYSDSVPVGHDSQSGAFITIEEEGRSSLRLDLSRPVGRRFEAGVRYTFYTQIPVGGTVRFSRHLGFVYLALSLGR